MLLLLGGILALYVVLCGVMWGFQRRLLFPAPHPVVVPVSSRGRLVSIPSNSTQPVTHAFYVPAPEQGPVLVWFHGNAEQIGDYSEIVEVMHRLGCGSFVVEYPGYGLDGAATASEANIMSAADNALQYLELVLSIPRERVVLVGRSLGTGVAVEMAWRDYGARMALFAPYTSLVDVAAQLIRWLPVRWLMIDRFDSLARASAVRQPVWIVHGVMDELIPVQMARVLHQRLSNSTLTEIQGAHHNDVFSVGGMRLFERLARFAKGQSPRE